MRYWSLIINTLIIFFISVFYTTSPVNAIEIFSKYNNNPLEVKSNIDNWDELGRMQPFITSKNGLYYMWYSTYNKTKINIARATSSNGLDWSSNYIVIEEDGRNTHDPSLLIENGEFITVYASSNSENNRISIIKSSDGINYNMLESTNIIFPDLSWKNRGVSAPYLFSSNSTYYLLYSGWGGDTWRIGMATSTDLINWTDCPNNPIISPGDGPTILNKNGALYLYYHMPTGQKGIKVTQSTDSPSCTMSWSNPKYVLYPGEPYDQNHMISPSVIEKNNITYLYYSGLGASGWTLNLATDKPIPDPQEQPALILIPGIFGSWNKDAILHNQTVGPNEWGPNPIVTEYDGITKTLENIGYIENQDYYTFFYDWRKPIEASTQNLQNFIQQNIDEDKKIDFVGHSLGGLISRIYAQQNPDANINKIVTVGTPHQGIPQVYKPLSAGEIQQNNSLIWLAQKALIQLYKDEVAQTDKDVITSQLPILYDLLSTNNFLKTKSGSYIEISNMSIKNNYLTSYSNSFPGIFPKLLTISGDKGNTTSGYIVAKRTPWDIFMGNYEDGHPVSNTYLPGDKTVTIASSSFAQNKTLQNMDHREIIYKADAIAQILDDLDIDHSPNQIIEGQRTVLFPSILFLMLSPARMEIIFNNQTKSEQQGIVHYQDAKNGLYNIKVHGQQKGQYKILIGQLTKRDNLWTTIYGSVNTNPPTAQTDTFSLQFNSTALNYPLTANELFAELTAYLKQINTPRKTVSILIKASKAHKKENYSRTRKLLLKTHRHLIQLYKSRNTSQKTDFFEAISKLEILYFKSLSNYPQKSSKKRLNRSLNTQRLIIKNYIKMLSGFNTLINTDKYRAQAQQINNKHELVEQALKDNNVNFAYIVLLTSNSLVRDLMSNFPW